MKNRHAINPLYEVIVPCKVVAIPQRIVIKGRTTLGPIRLSHKLDGSSMRTYGMNVIVNAMLYYRRKR